jgi:hypothetical protein
MRPSGRHKDAEGELIAQTQEIKQTEVKSTYRKKAGNLDTEYQQPVHLPRLGSLLCT